MAMIPSLFTFADWYDALERVSVGPGRRCTGRCEGTGIAPVHCQPVGLMEETRVWYRRESNPLLRHLWVLAHRRSHGVQVLPSAVVSAWRTRSLEPLRAVVQCDGWHFVKCPDCDGSGLRARHYDELPGA